MSGPYRYGRLQRHILSRIPAFSHIDLCRNPNAVCEVDEVMWAGAIYEWSTQVEKNKFFAPSLQLYVDGGFSLPASEVGKSRWEPAADFVSGAGNVMQEGTWGPYPVGQHKRKDLFLFLIKAFRDAGLSPPKKIAKKVSSPGPAPAKKTSSSKSIRCGKGWGDANQKCGKTCTTDSDLSLIHI